MILSVLHSSNRITNVRETRVASVIAHLLIGVSMIFLLPYPLVFIPRAVLDGLLLYMAATSVKGNEMFERVLLLATEQVCCLTILSSRLTKLIGFFTGCLSTDSLHKESSTTKSPFFHCLSTDPAPAALRMWICPICLYRNDISAHNFLLLSNQVSINQPLTLLKLFTIYS